VNPPLPNSAPVIQLTASETTILAGNAVHFNAASTYDPDGDAMEFRWEFGDGASGVGESASHTYRKAGTYNPVLIVTDERGRVSSSFLTIEVLPPNGGRGVLSFNASDRSRKIAYTRGAGYMPVGYWNNTRERMSAEWYDSAGQPVDISFTTTGNHSVFPGTHPVDPFNGDTVLAEINVGKRSWGADEGFTIQVGNIPYAVYDVYVYYAGSNTTTPSPIDLNGIRRWAWKQGHDFPGQWVVSEAATSSEAINGHNLILWRNLMGSELVLSLPLRNGEAISGFQIVDKTGSPDAPPVVAIQSPGNGEWYFVGETVQLVGTAEDSEGPLGDPFLEWSSSINGTLGTGSALNVSNLSVGTHTLTLTATNSANLQSTASVVIDVFSSPAAPVIVGQPQDITSYETATVQFTVVATGSPPFFTYQWIKDGEPLSDGLRVAGALTHTLTLSDLNYDDEGEYQVVVTNEFGHAFSTIATLQVTELIAPQITSQPQGGVINEGSELVLTVGVSGSEPFTYQWRRNGVPLTNGGVVTGANSNTLRISNFGLQHEGSYDVVVSNAGGFDESHAAVVTLFVLPSMDAVIAEWNFNHFTATADSNGFEEILEADLGTGILFLRSSTATGTNLRRNTGGGTDVNASDGIPAGGSLELRRGGRWNNGIVEFRFDMTGLEAAIISFAYRTFSSIPTTATVEWSIDGGVTYSTFATLVNADYTSMTLVALDFTEVTALNDLSDVRVRLRYSEDGGAASSGSTGFFDNVRIEARRISSGYEDWRIARFGDVVNPDGEPEADPLQRAIPNLLEYALGLDLLVNPHAGLPVVSDGMEIRFTRRATVDARIIIEESTSLDPNNWTTIAILEPGASLWSGSAEIQETMEEQIYHVIVAHPEGEPTSLGPRFTRLRIEMD
jgi:hypothetical protein